MLDQEKWTDGQENIQSPKAEVPSGETPVTEHTGNTGKQENVPAEKNDQGVIDAAPVQEKTGKKRKKKEKQAETGSDLPETGMPPKKRKRRSKSG